MVIMFKRSKEYISSLLLLFPLSIRGEPHIESSLDRILKFHSETKQEASSTVQEK